MTSSGGCPNCSAASRGAASAARPPIRSPARPRPGRRRRPSPWSRRRPGSSSIIGSESVRLANPALPAFLDDLILRDVTVAGSRLDLRLSRVGGDVTTAVTRRQGPARLTIEK